MSTQSEIEFWRGQLDQCKTNRVELKQQLIAILDRGPNPETLVAFKKRQAELLSETHDQPDHWEPSPLLAILAAIINFLTFQCLMLFEVHFGQGSRLRQVLAQTPTFKPSPDFTRTMPMDEELKNRFKQERKEIANPENLEFFSALIDHLCLLDNELNLNKAEALLLALLLNKESLEVHATDFALFDEQHQRTALNLYLEKMGGIDAIVQPHGLAVSTEYIQTEVPSDENPQNILTKLFGMKKVRPHAWLEPVALCLIIRLREIIAAKQDRDKQEHEAHVHNRRDAIKAAGLEVTLLDLILSKYFGIETFGNNYGENAEHFDHLIHHSPLMLSPFDKLYADIVNDWRIDNSADLFNTSNHLVRLRLDSAIHQRVLNADNKDRLFARIDALQSRMPHYYGKDYDCSSMEAYASHLKQYVEKNLQTQSCCQSRPSAGGLFSDSATSSSQVGVSPTIQDPNQSNQPLPNSLAPS